jgi:hypothetical protein
MASRHPSQPPPHLPNGTTGDPKRSPCAQFVINFIQLPLPGRSKRHWFTRRASQHSLPIGLFPCALHASSHPFHLRDCAALAFEFRVISVNFYSVSVCKYDSMPPHPGSPDVSGEPGWGAAWRLIGPLRLPQDTGAIATRESSQLRAVTRSRTHLGAQAPPVGGLRRGRNRETSQQFSLG